MDGSKSIEGGVLAAALARNREKLNAKFEYHTRALRRPIDNDEFLLHILENIGPALDAVAKVDHGKVDHTLSELFDISLELMGAGYLGLKSGYVWPERAFRELLPPAAPFLGQNPRLIASSLINGALNIEKEAPSGKPEKWAGHMIKAAGLAQTQKELLDAGLALSWLCGMAHYRRGALDVIAAMPERLSLALFAEFASGKPAGKGQLITSLGAIWHDKQYGPDAKPAKVVGGFTGYAGPFSAPPTVFLDNGSIVIQDGGDCFELFADRFGALVKRRRGGADAPPWQSSDGRMEEYIRKNLNAANSLWDRKKSWAFDDHTLAITLKVSHKVFIFPLKGP